MNNKRSAEPAPDPLASVDLLAPRLRRELRTKVGSLKAFSSGFVGIDLFPYQLEAGEAIARSVLRRDGETFVLIFARQSGKDELLANLILFLLARLAERGASIVCAQPTFRPQTLNAMDRLQARASQRPFFTSGGFGRHHGHIYRLLSARVTYLSADPSASVVGATADRLLIINEAQDVSPTVYDKRFAPMAASGNATRVFSGTSWTVDTLLDREKRRALQLEKRDGLRRVFIVDGDGVALHNGFYGRYLRQEIGRLGREHPLVRTQYFCENVDARSGMFTPAHRALMAPDRPISSISNPQSQVNNAFAQGGVGPPLRTPSPPGDGVAFLLDVAGQEESNTSLLEDGGRVEVQLIRSRNLAASGPRARIAASRSDRDPGGRAGDGRDAITLRIVEIDLSTLPSLHAPTYRVVHTLQWTGENHITVFGQLKSLAESWRPLHIVMDATGVGEGLWAMLDKAFPTRVIPVKFTQQVKSELGYGFLAIINTGRFRDCDPSPETDRQYAACESEILIGPARTMRWGVPDGRRDEDGRLIHDDIVVADSLTAILDRLNWTVSSPTVIIPPRDPLEDMSHFHDDRQD